MSTLKDVAALAQCSLTTASIVANGRGDEMHISPATQQRVAEAIQQLQYRPDRGAQLLRAGRRRLTIALYWPLDHRTTLLGDRLYNFYSILQQEQEPADPYELLIQTYFSGRLGEMLSPILQGRYDGVIIGGAGEQDLIQLENADISTPLVLINAESRKYSTAGVNHTQTGSQAAALIHQKGYRECAVIRGGDHYDGTSQRTKAFLNSCRQLGIRIQPEWTFQAAPTIAGGAAATEEYCVLRQRPRVIYYENDSMAQGGLYTLARSGIHVPQDTEVLCIGLRKPEMNHCLNPQLHHHPADGGPAGRCPAAPPHPGAASCPLACGNGATGPASGILYPAGKCPCGQPVKMFHVKHLFAFDFSAPSFSPLVSKHPPTGGCLLYCGLSSLRLTRTPTLLHRTQPALLSC